MKAEMSDKNRHPQSYPQRTARNKSTSTKLPSTDRKMIDTINN
jgi:hypothetical protein